ncbi:N-6 DNA methylase [Sphingomonas sp.]|uniref:N-6 DNA methylase n=1 Tax=Sphingomonas sp. TaxID=28214 RepID=UPI0035BC0580
MVLNTEALRATLVELAKRPKHEAVRSLLFRLLTDGLGAEPSSIRQEERMEVSGRVDAMLGRTIIEIKSNLDRELADGERQLTGYLQEKERRTGQPWVGILTDGADFHVYGLRPQGVERAGELERIGGRKVKDDLKGAPRRDFLVWLESVVAIADSLEPEPDVIRAELGRESPLYIKGGADLEGLWARHRSNPEVATKRALWSRLLQVAYGDDVAGDTLFLQHTYLVIVAKTLATQALADRFPNDARDLLDGRAFQDLGITGAVEADFFDWILADEDGSALVMAIANQARRFQLHTVQADVLKALYESLIDPAERHFLGEYYTPDWLAARVCEAAITDPLNQRVIDPACGSGTFLFHSVRRLLAAAEKEGIAPADAVARAASLVAGIDVHPVAVIFARATFLLALAGTMAQGRPRSIALPVYLGDSLQWNRAEVVGRSELEILVPAAETWAGGRDSPGAPGQLRFPESIVADPALLDEAVQTMIRFADEHRSAKDFARWAEKRGVASEDVKTLCGTAEVLTRLIGEDRDHIWGYVARNLSRPIWLSGERQRADVVVGNPPWLRYSSMSQATQKLFKDDSARAGIWVGGKSATANDLSALFFARAVSLYMKTDGRIAFVMPYAAMSRDPYAEFRKGDFFPFRKSDAVRVRFTEGWALPSQLTPLFPVPACVLFAERTAGKPGKLPQAVIELTGRMPNNRRDASPDQAATVLQVTNVPWPTAGDVTRASPYRDRFVNGATLWPRRLVLVEKLPAGRLGANPEAPRVRSRITTLDKKPWSDLDPLEGPIEAEFLRPVWLGESIAPYRRLTPALGIIPYDETGNMLLDADAASARNHTGLARWLKRAEKLWDDHGSGKMSFERQIDYMRKLSGQFPIASLRLVFSKAGTQPAACLIEDHHAIIEQALYWIAPKSLDEGRYLMAVFNSETIRAASEQWQSEGQFGARHFDRVALNLPIPEFGSGKSLHLALAAAAEEAEQVAAGVEIDPARPFTDAHSRIRSTLRSHGVAERIDNLVAELIGQEPPAIVQTKSGEKLVLRGYGALADQIEVRKGIDLSKPVAEQVARLDRNEARRKRASHV